jgi:TrmH family RNA methyltransferase
MVRTADAAGVTAVLVADEVVDAFNPNAIRASTGAVFALPAVAADREGIVEFLRARGVALFAAALGGDRAHTDADLTGPAAIVIGPEDAGLDQAWLAAARASQPRGGLLKIPMRGRSVDSLNAAAAAAILLFEAVRQRSIQPPRYQPR